MEVDQSSPPSEADIHVRLRKLNEIEDDVMKLMEIAAETVAELQQVPHCNFNEIGLLSKAFSQITRNIQEDLKNQADIFNLETSHEEYPSLLEKKEDICHGLEKM